MGGPKIDVLEDVTTPKPCPWRGKDKKGDFLQCNNFRLMHPKTTVLDKATKKQVPLQLGMCGYHVKECITDSHDHPVTIRTPNAGALCTECYTTANPGVRMAANLTQESCPGVSGVSMQASSLGAPSAAAGEGTDGFEKQYTAASACEWKPGKRELKIRGWICTCKVYQNPETQVFLATCGMHIKTCLGKHEGGGGDVTIPNIYGLCVMHHTALKGYPPEPVAFPFPGMKFKKTQRALMLENHHWAAPKFPYTKAVEVAVYEAPEEPEDFIQQVDDSLYHICIYTSIYIDFIQQVDDSLYHICIYTSIYIDTKSMHAHVRIRLHTLSPRTLCSRHMQ